MTREELIKKVNSFQGANREFSQELPPIIEAILDEIDEAGPEVVDNLTSNSPTKALSANQGKELKLMVDEKVSAPETAGTPGQVLSVDENGDPEWVDAAEGGTYDGEMSGSSTNAPQNKTVKKYVDENFAKQDGYYEKMGVGIAKNLEGRSVVTGAFFGRTTGGEADMSNGTGQLQEVKGNSVKFNQLVQNGNFADSSNWDISSGGTATVASNIMTFVGDNTGSAVSQYFTRIESHKYYLRLSVKPSVNVNKYRWGLSASVRSNIVANQWNRLSAIQDSGTNLYLTYNIADTNTYQFANSMLIDLTALGIDNLTTVDEVEAWLAENIGLFEYYPYTPGSVVNVNMTGLKSVSRNLLDPTTGKANIIGAYSDVYGNYYGIVGTHGTLTFTDNLGNESTITPDSDGKFLLEVPGVLTVATPGADCSVFHWWDGSKTDYSEHEVDTANVDLTHIWGKKNGAGDLVRVWPTGAPGLGDIKDMLRVEDGQVVARRVMGEQTVTGAIGDTITLTGCDTSVTDYLCGANIGTLSAGVLTLTSATSNANVYFKLATPEVYTDLVYMGSSIFPDGTPVTLPVNYNVDNWGDEIVLPKNSSAGILTARPTIVTKYSIDAVEQLDTLRNDVSEDCISVGELKANLASLASYLCTNYPEVFTPAFTVNDEPNTGTKVFGFHEIEPEPEP